MSVTLPRTLLVAALLSPSLTWALGLGEIHLNSSLNEPMKAEIDLIAAAPDELAALRASLAGRDAFTRYGIDRPPFLNSLTFKVGKSKDGRDVLLVNSSEAIPEPFVTFLVEVNWARGRLMREYTVLLDPPVYTPGDTATASAPVSAPSTTTAPAVVPSTADNGASAADSTSSPAAAVSGSGKRRAGGRRGSRAAASSEPATVAADSGAAAGDLTASGSYTVAQGDTLAKIARSLHADTPAAMDKTMIALYRANPDAFGGNINILKKGAVLRVPEADAVAALNQREAVNEVHRQMDAWRGAEAPSGGHLRLVSPSASGAGSGTTAGSKSGARGDVNGAETQALRDRVRDLEGQVAEQHRLLELKNSELNALQQKFGTKPVTPAQPPVAAIPSTPPPPVVAPTPPVVAPSQPPPTVVAPATPPSAVEAPPSAVDMVPVPVKPPVKKPVTASPPADSGSWIDWVAANWWIPAAILALLLAGLGFAAWRKRRRAGDDPGGMDSTDVNDFRDPTARLSNRKGNESFVVEESGEHPVPDFGAEPAFDDLGQVKSPEDTMSSESAVNLDQGDPLAEADFHMAYGLYDQAADLVRIALEREPDRRDLRMKLLEIYFVWGNKDAFLQTAKGLESTRDRAPAGEWDKIIIMGKQICPDEPMFAHSTGSGRGSGAPIDLNLEGGENRVDIDLFGEPGGEHGIDHALGQDDDAAATGERGLLHHDSGLDFTLDAPERGVDDSPTREMAPAPRDEPTVESELMNFADAPTQESPSLKTAQMRNRVASKLDAINSDHTAEVSLDDLGLDLDQLEQTGAPSHLEDTDHPSDAPTMVAGLDERSRKMMADAAASAHDRDLTELERELEASFVADLEPHHDDEIKTAVLGPEAAPTVLMPREIDQSETSRFDMHDGEKVDIDSTSKLRGLNSDSIDLDLDRLASALASGDTIDQPRQAEDLFSSEVFDATSRSRSVDLDVGEALNGAGEGTNRLVAKTNKLKSVDLAIPELEPVTMSEVGTKLDLARAYMDMGDPEGARSILEEVVQEGSASQKHEASRLIESLPG